MKRADRVAAASDARDERIWEAPGLSRDLIAYFVPDNALEVPDDHRVRVRSHDGTNQVVRREHVGCPIAQGFVDRVLERPRSEFHPEHVKLLTLHILSPHIDFGFEPQCRTRDSSRYPVLPCSCFSDNACFPHALRKQCLAERIVDLMGAAVSKILAL